MADCKQCEFYRKSDKCPVFRCDVPDNMYDGPYGTCYLKAPASKNWNFKCKDYKEKK